jgi:uncharacterized membrane protein
VLLTSTAIAVLGMNVLAVALVLGRAVLFHTRLYRPMLLNVGLSVAPLVLLTVGTVGILLLVAVGVAVPVLLVLTVVLALLWLLLLPNAGYLITELNLSHRRDDDPVPEGYDVLLVLCLAVSGVLNTLVNVFLVQLVYVAIRYDDVHRLRGGDLLAVVGLVLVLVSFGIYLGRNVRVNSWDVARPWRLVGRVVAHLREPGRARAALGFTVVAAAFFALMYLAVVGPIIDTLVATSS